MSDMVLILKPLRRPAIDLLERDGARTVLRIDAPSEVDVRANLPGAAALCVKNTPIPADLLAQCPGLRVVCKHGVGLDNLPMAALTDRRIPVLTVGDANAGSVAEHAMMLMLAVSRRVIQYDARTRAGGYITDPAWPTHALAGKRLLLVGVGRIGSRVAHLARAFGMTVEAVDPGRTDGQDGIALAADLHAGLAQADCVSLHCPLLPETAHIADAAFFAAMKPGAMLINTARGELVDEAALLSALDAGQLAGAGLDVFETEPPDPAAAIFRDHRIVVTPHTAALTEDVADAMSMITARNAIDGLAGRFDPAFLANPEVLS